MVNRCSHPDFAPKFTHLQRSHKHRNQHIHSLLRVANVVKLIRCIHTWSWCSSVSLRALLEEKGPSLRTCYVSHNFITTRVIVQKVCYIVDRSVDRHPHVIVGLVFGYLFQGDDALCHAVDLERKPL